MPIIDIIEYSVDRLANTADTSHNGYSLQLKHSIHNTKKRKYDDVEEHDR
jgi:hypothetical protein